MARHLLWRVVIGTAVLLFPHSAHAQLPVRSYADAFVKKFSPDDPQVNYVLTVGDSDRRLIQVEMDIWNVRDSTLALQLPNWVPGAYWITNAWRRVSNLVAIDSAGTPVAITRPDSLTWVLHNGIGRRMTVRYAVDPTTFAYTSGFLRRETGLVQGPFTFLYLVGRQHLPSHVRFVLPPGWHAGTGLMATPDSTVFFAPSYDVLIDTPILLGRFQRWVFSAGGTPHQVLVANDGEPVPFDTLAFVDVVRRITETTIGIFGQAPYKDYTYIFVTAGGGGLEHLNSTTLGIDPEALARDVRAAASNAAHEFFHTWNVKRIRPAVLGPFEYTREQHTTSLWFSEGVTVYYADLILVRSALASQDELRRSLASTLGNYLNNYCYRRTSPEGESWQTWEPDSRRDSGCIASYYATGKLLGALLDIAIRDSTDNRRSLDDLFRYLFEHFAGERGFEPQDLVRAVNEVSGRDFQAFFERHVGGTADIPWNDYLGRIGWRMTLRDSVVPVDRRIFIIPPGESPVFVGSSPYYRAVMYPWMAVTAASTLRTGDEIMRVDGVDARDAEALRPLRELRAGQTIILNVLRDGRPLTVRVRGVPYRRIVADVSEVPNPSARAFRLRQGILSGTTEPAMTRGSS